MPDGKCLCSRFRALSIQINPRESTDGPEFQLEETTYGKKRHYNDRGSSVTHKDQHQPAKRQRSRPPNERGGSNNVGPSPGRP